MKNFLLKIKLFRKQTIKLCLKYRQHKEQKYLDYLRVLAKPISTEMYTIIYNFLVKAGMMHLLEDYYYQENQQTVKQFLISELQEEFYLIKQFLISVMDARLANMTPKAVELIFNLNFIDNDDVDYIIEKLEKVKLREDFFESDFHFNEHVNVVNETIEFYRTLEEASAKSIENKIVSISKALNVMHYSGYCFFNYSNTDNFLPIFNMKQAEAFSSIPLCEIETKLKKLLA